ncbi:MAG: CsbD family protein [Caldimonas sp.]
MNKDQVKGRLEEAKGAVKETTGKVVGSTKLKTQGLAEKAAGKTQATYGDAKSNAKKG